MYTSTVAGSGEKGLLKSNPGSESRLVKEKREKKCEVISYPWADEMSKRKQNNKHNKCRPAIPVVHYRVVCRVSIEVEVVVSNLPKGLLPVPTDRPKARERELANFDANRRAQKLKSGKEC